MLFRRVLQRAPMMKRCFSGGPITPAVSGSTPATASAGESAVASAKSSASKPAPSSGGSSFLQRFSSFLVGAGLGFSLSFYFIYNELKESNVILERQFSSLEKRLSQIEDSK